MTGHPKREKRGSGPSGVKPPLHSSRPPPQEPPITADEVPQVPVPLRFIGFCGLDTTVSVASFLAFIEDPVVQKYLQYIEFGVLLRPEKEGQPRFITETHLEQLVNALRDKKARSTEHGEGSRTNYDVNFAAHLCSSVCLSFLGLRSAEQENAGKTASEWLDTLVALRVGRIQVNATKANNADISDVKEEEREEVRRTVSATLKEHETRLEFIFQVNEETEPLYLPFLADLVSTVASPAEQRPHLSNAEETSPKRQKVEQKEPCKVRNSSFLLDSSIGTGKEISSFSFPSLHSLLEDQAAKTKTKLELEKVTDELKIGYAGGISPDTVRAVALRMHSDDFVQQLSRAVAGKGEGNPRQKVSPLWIDMESGVRETTSEGDVFSLHKVKQVVAVIDELVSQKVLVLKK